MYLRMYLHTIGPRFWKAELQMLRQFDAPWHQPSILMIPAPTCLLCAYSSIFPNFTVNVTECLPESSVSSSSSPFSYLYHGSKSPSYVIQVLVYREGDKVGMLCYSIISSPNWCPTHAITSPYFVLNYSKFTTHTDTVFHNLILNTFGSLLAEKVACILDTCRFEQRLIMKLGNCEEYLSSSFYE